MRVFSTLKEAIGEIKRDVVKGSSVTSSRVQNLEVEKKAFEVLNYGYAILPGGIPQNPSELYDIGHYYFPLDFAEKDRPSWVTWFEEEAEARIEGRVSIEPPDSRHPVLAQYLEGSAFSYTYAERTVGMVKTVVSVLQDQPDSRRVFWPIFRPEDAIRAKVYTRIPCTLGYSFLLRGDFGDQLHVTLLSRSTDLEKFLISDIAFAARIQKAVAEELDVNLGNTVHEILSLHMFDRGEEIF